MNRQAGQASVEVLAALPALALAALIAWQLAVTGYSLHVADGAAEAGALAKAAGTPVEPAVHAALPGWARGRISVSTAGGRVHVSVRPPAPLPVVSRALEVRASAWARPGDGDG